MRPMKYRIPVAVSFWAVLATLVITTSVQGQTSTNMVGGAGQPRPAQQDQPDGPWYRSNEILIKFKPGATDAQVADIVRLAGVTAAKHILTPAMQESGDIGITRGTTRLPVAQAVQALQNHPGIEY